jgi:hypothetical protein
LREQVLEWRNIVKVISPHFSQRGQPQPKELSHRFTQIDTDKKSHSILAKSCVVNAHPCPSVAKSPRNETILKDCKTLSGSKRRFSIGFQRHRERKGDCKPALQNAGILCGA